VGFLLIASLSVKFGGVARFLVRSPPRLVG
jgi:hypothetical protein